MAAVSLFGRLIGARLVEIDFARRKVCAWYGSDTVLVFNEEGVEIDSFLLPALPHDVVAARTTVYESCRSYLSFYGALKALTPGAM